MTESPQSPRYVIVLSIPREIEILIEDRFLDLAGLTRPTIGYHVTVLGPFEQRCESAHAVREIMAQIAADTSPVPLSLDGLGAFSQPNRHVALIKVARTPLLLELQRRLRLELDPHIQFAQPHLRVWNEPDQYHPHVTLGMDLTDAEHAALQRAASPDFDATISADTLILYAQSPNEPWAPMATCVLGRADTDSSDTGY